MTNASTASGGALRYRLVCFVWAIALLADDINESLLIVSRVNCHLKNQNSYGAPMILAAISVSILYIYINKLAISDCIDCVGDFFNDLDLTKIEKYSILAPLFLVPPSFKYGWRTGLAVMFIYVLHSLLIVVLAIIFARLFSFYMKLEYSHESLARLWVEGCASW